MASTWGNSWLSTWGVSWDRDTSQPPTPPQTTPYPAPAGRSRKRRSVVEVDGELHEVRGWKEAESLIRTLKERAVEEAPVVAKKALSKARTAERKTGERPEVQVMLPQVRVEDASPALTDWINQEVARIHETYLRAVREAEEAMAARKAYFEQDEEDAIIALLLH